MIKRNITKVIEELDSKYPVLIITGLDQSGKMTLIENLKSSLDKKVISLEDKELREYAQKNPKAFIENVEPPVLIDEIQYGLNLMPYINNNVTKNQGKGKFWLIGTHMCDLFDTEGTSLGDNIGIAKMMGLTYYEITGVEIDLYNIAPYENNSIRNQIFRGSFPALYGEGSFANKENYFDQYLQKFLRTEAKQMAKVGNIMQFRKFMCAVAKRTGELLNYANLSKDVNISQPTAKQWMSVLYEGGIVTFLKPYANEKLTRVVDVPRMYFTDTGLCAYLAGIKKPEKLFKTWVVTEIMKRYYNLGIIPPLYHYRDKDGKEVDLIIEDGNKIQPIKIIAPKNNDMENKVYYNGFAKKGILAAPWKSIEVKKK